jgi:C4-dicarboxylate-specific signal transduction histidine kinase
VQSLYSTRLWFLFIAAVGASAWFGGQGPGWLAALLSMLAVESFFPLRHAWTVHGENIPFHFSFAVVALLASWFSAWRRRIEAALRQARDELEVTVEERTMELRKANEVLRAESAERQRAQEAFNQLQEHLAHVNRVMTMAELTAFIAHELNQPLAAVVTSANACEHWLAGDAPDLEKAREALGRIVKAGMMASEVVARERAIFQRSPSERQRLDVNEVIRETTNLLRHETMRRGVSVRTDLAADLPPVTADRVQIQQLLLNLVMNGLDAIKATPDQSGELHIRSRRENFKEVLVMVQDSGVGLDAELAEKIFSPFFTTKSHGLGLGLTISRSIVESHGGLLWAVPSPSRGATFQFTLPAEDKNGD